MSKSPELLSPLQRMRYAVTPLRLYTKFRTQRYSTKGSEPELDVLPHLIDRHRVCVDAGANRGSYTCFLSGLTKHVFAYEPNPSMHKLLQRSAAKNVTVSQVALSNESGEAEFAVPKRDQSFANNSGSLEIGQLNDSHEDLIRFTVPTRRLDDEGLVDVGFIKLDVEGHEQQVLLGAQELIARDRPVLLMEIIESFLDHKASESVQFVEQMGYQCFVLLNKRLVDYSMLTAEEEASKGWDRREPTVRSNNYIFLPVERARRAA